MKILVSWRIKSMLFIYSDLEKYIFFTVFLKRFKRVSIFQNIPSPPKSYMCVLYWKLIYSHVFEIISHELHFSVVSCNSNRGLLIFH
jgi:hypothetical protein